VGFAILVNFIFGMFLFFGMNGRFVTLSRKIAVNGFCVIPLTFGKSNWYNNVKRDMFENEMIFTAFGNNLVKFWKCN
jgi:hypothetical protein